jgi:hypothetical protein
LEPYECLFCLDVVERSFRDILAVTKQYSDPSMAVTEYQPLKRVVGCVWATLAHPLGY